MRKERGHDLYSVLFPFPVSYCSTIFKSEHNNDSGEGTPTSVARSKQHSIAERSRGLVKGARVCGRKGKKLQSKPFVCTTALPSVNLTKIKSVDLGDGHISMKSVCCVSCIFKCRVRTCKQYAVCGTHQHRSNKPKLSLLVCLRTLATKSTPPGRSSQARVNMFHGIRQKEYIIIRIDN